MSLFLDVKVLRYRTMNKVPIAIKIQPTSDLRVNCSCKNINANTKVMTTLSLSIGTTFEACPNCNAR